MCYGDPRSDWIWLKFDLNSCFWYLNPIEMSEIWTRHAAKAARASPYRSYRGCRVDLPRKQQRLES